MRLFISINPASETIEKIMLLVNTLKADIPQLSYTKAENIHLTLKFLGERQDFENPETINKLSKAIDESVMGVKNFSLKFFLLGCFVHEQLIVYLKGGDNPELIALVEHLNDNLKRLDIPRDSRIFRPHITLARGKKLSFFDVKKISNKIKLYKLENSIEMSVNKVSLMQSELNGNGSIYTTINHSDLLT
jgi:2'-5' RNA ligase